MKLKPQKKARSHILTESAENITLTIGPRTFTILPHRGRAPGFNVGDGLYLDGDWLYVTEDATYDALGVAFAQLVDAGIHSAIEDKPAPGRRRAA